MLEFLFHLTTCLLAVAWISERVAKRIPDSATGWRGKVRDVARTIAQYSENVK